MSPESVLNGAWSVWCRPWPLARLVSSVLISLLVVYLAALVYLGGLHTNLFGHDYFLFLDSGWRVLQGQRPHIDFHSAHGPLFSLYTAFAIRAGAGNVSVGFGIARALATAALTVWCFLLLRNRIVPAAAVLLCLFVALLAGAPFALSSSPFSQSMAMFYNRFGYVLLALLIIEGFRPAPSGFRGGFSSGVAISMMLFLKINFFGASLGFLALSLLVSRPRWQRLAGLTAGFMSLTLPMLVWLRFDIPAIASDFHDLAVSRSSTLPLRRFLHTLDASLLPMLLLLSLAIIVTILNWNKRKGLLHGTYSIVLALAAIIAELAVGIANQEDAVFCIMSVCCLLFLASLPDAGTDRVPQLGSLLGAVLILGLCLPLPGCIYDFVGLGNALQHAFRHGNDQRLFRIDAPGLSSFVFEGDYPGIYRYDNGPPLVEVVNDGLQLLRAHTAASDRVLTLGYVNPFPVCLRRPAPRGPWVFFYLNFNFKTSMHPPAESLFAEADAVMVPRFDSDAKPTTDALVAIYRSTLAQDYVIKAESPFWILYTRRNPRTALMRRPAESDWGILPAPRGRVVPL